MSDLSPCHGLPATVVPGGLESAPDAFVAFCTLVDSHRTLRPARGTILLEGEAVRGIYFLASGWMTTSKSMPDGHRVVVDVVLPGSFLDPASADPGVSSVGIDALTDVAVATIPRTSWRRLLGEQKVIREAVDLSVAAATSRLAERMLRLGRGSADTRIAYALWELCLRSSATSLAEGRVYHIPMTQADLGDFAGLSAVHVCRTLRRFERAGILSASNHMDVEIRDLDALARVAQIDPVSLPSQIIPTI